MRILAAATQWKPEITFISFFFGFTGIFEILNIPAQYFLNSYDLVALENISK